VTELGPIRSHVETQPTPRPKQPHRNPGAEQRIQELVNDRKRDRQRIADLEREGERQKRTLQARDNELAQLRAEAQKQKARLEKVPERIAEAREKGRKLFGDFDAVVAGVPVDQEAFLALLASTNGPELMYAAGLGMRMIGVLRQLRGQAEADKQRVDYYRELHRQHFAGGNSVQQHPTSGS